MSPRFQGRHGHVRRRSSSPAAEPSSASPAELRPEPPAPVPVAPPEPPPKQVFEEFQGGARRSVFDLLKEKYPDLGGGVPPAKPLIAPTPPPVASGAAAAQEKAAQEKAAREKAAQEKAAQEKLAREKAAQEKAAQEKLAREKAAQEKAAQERAAREKAAQEKAALEKLAREKAALEKATQEKAALERTAQEKATQDKLAREKAALEKAALERVALEKATQDKLAREKAALEKAALERVALEKAAQEELARETAAQERVAQEKLARETAALEGLDGSTGAEGKDPNPGPPSSSSALPLRREEPSWSSAVPGSRQILRPEGRLADGVAQEKTVQENATEEKVAQSVAPAAAVEVPEAALPSVPPFRATRRPALPPKRVLAFWAGIVLVLVAGIFLLSQWKPAPAASAPVAVPTPALPPAGALSLEPEKVVVLPPAKEPAAAAVPPRKETRPAATPRANPQDKKAEPKPAPPKPEPSRMVIEPVAPIVPPVRIGGSQPEYPVEARAAGVEGTVVLYGLIGRDGKVREARVVRGLSPPLDAAALAAFRTWRFSPATQKGKKVEFKYNAGIEFRINFPAEQVAATSEPEGAPAAPAAAAPDAPLPYGGNFTAPVRTTMVWPQKPPGAQMVKGEVTLQLIVGKSGEVQDIDVVAGLPQGVTEAAIEAVRQWKFRPARQNGEPVTVYHRVSLRF